MLSDIQMVPPPDGPGDRSRQRHLSLYYFVSFSGFGVLTFLPLVLSGRGLSSAEIALVMTMTPLVTVIAPPVWGAIADITQARVKVLRALSVGAAVSVLLLAPSLGVLGTMLGMGVFCVFRTAIAPLLDAATQTALGPRREAYPRIRLWGSIGYVLGSLIAGALDKLHATQNILAVAGVLFLVAAMTSSRLHVPPTARQPAVLSRAVAFMKGANLYPVFIANGVYYMAQSTFDVNFPLYLNELGRRDLVGPTWCLAVSCEVAMMFYAPRLLRARSLKHVMVFCAAVSVVRWLLTSLTSDPALIWGTQALYGITFALWYVAAVRHAQERSPDELRGSVQSALNAFMACGTVAGYLIGGPIFDRFGGAWAFRFSAIVAAAALVMYGVLVAQERASFGLFALLGLRSARGTGPASEAAERDSAR